MATKREYLVGLELTKPGRGKFSASAKEALAKAEAEGMTFAEPPSVVTRNPRPTGKLKKTKSGGQIEIPDYIAPSDFRFPENEYEAVADDGSVYSMRECCNTCKVSLTNHMCNSPSVLGLVPVTIRERR